MRRGSTKLLARLLVALLTLGVAGAAPAARAQTDTSPADTTTASPADPFAPRAGAGRAAGSGLDVDRTNLLVRFQRDLPTGAADRALARHGLARGRAITGTGFVRVATNGREPEALRRGLSQEAAVDVVEVNRIRRAAVVPNDAHVSGGRRYIDTLRLPQAWDVARGSTSLVIAIVDSGVDASHPDLAGRVLPGRDFVAGDNDATDEDGHGTRVAGIAAAKPDNGTGIAGAAWDASILPVRVLDASGGGSDAGIAEGIVWAADHGAKVINLSLGGPGRSATLESAVRYAVSRDVVVVAASGNDGAPVENYPAAYPDVLAVGATDDAGRVVAFSQWGPWVDLVAPGVSVLSTTRGGGTSTASGTSFSSPFVAGIAALVRAQRPSWNQAQVAGHLKGGARDAGPPGDDDAYGAGVVDALAAVAGDVQPPVAMPPVEGNESNAWPARSTLLDGTSSREMSPEEDVDWYHFDVAETTGLLVNVTVTPPPKNQLYDIDPIVAVFDPQLRLVQELDSVGASTPESLDYVAAPGRNYVQVRNFNPSVGSSPYTISLTRRVPAAATPGGATAVVRDTTPADLTAEASTSTAPAITFARAMDTSTLGAGVRLVHGRTGALVPTSNALSADGRTVTLTPSAPLAPGTAHHLVVDVRDAGGARLAGVAARFRTAGATPPVTLAPVPPPPPPPAATSTSSGSSTSAGSGTAAPPASRSGYWMVSAAGAVYGFGDARWFGNTPALPAGTTAVDLEPTPSLGGYWIVSSSGHLYTFGDAPYLGAVNGGLTGGETVTSISATPTGRGYWMFTTRGRVVGFGDAPFLGDMSGTRLNGPVLDSIPTPTGRGYYMVASDGGIFTFGDAGFRGSMGGVPLNAPVQSLVPDRDGEGYWLVASDGGIFSFDAPFRGSMGDTRLNGPITGMVRFGNGYLMVGTDGGIFTFTDKEFFGSLGDNPPPSPIASVAVAEG